MKTLTPQEATDLAYNTTGADTILHALSIFDYCYSKRLGESKLKDQNWALYCAAAACYNAGRVDGIRAERERRKKGKQRNKEGGVRNGGTHHHHD